MPQEDRDEAILRELRTLGDRMRRLEERVEGLVTPLGAAPGQVLRTHVEGLDELLGGGIPKGHALLLRGPPGSGKTALALAILMGLRTEDQAGLYVAMEEGRTSLQATGARAGLDVPNDMIVDGARLRLENPDARGDWLTILGNFLQRRRAEGRVDVAVVDPLDFLVEGGGPNARVELFRFIAQGKALGLTLMLIEGGGGQMEEALVDGILEFIVVQGSRGEREVHVRCPKMRHMAHGRRDLVLEFQGRRLVARPLGP